jgi:hypothetical protein
MVLRARLHCLGLLGACCALALAAPLTLADGPPDPLPTDGGGSAVGQPVVIVPHPPTGQVTGPPLSSLPAPIQASIEVRSGAVAKSVAVHGSTSLPLGEGLVEAEVRFPFAIDAGATGVSVQAAGGASAWQVEQLSAPSAESLALALRGSGPADLQVEMRPPQTTAGVRFRLTLTSELAIVPGDAGQTARVPVSQQLRLDLPEGYMWTVSVADPTLVGEVPGAPGVYEALAPGRTSLAVNGDPACYRAGHGCLLPSLSFQVQLVVTP